MIINDNKEQINNIDYESNKNKKEYSFGNNVIILELINDKLRITIKHMTEFNSQIITFQKDFSQEQLNELNKIFTIFDKVDDSINLIYLSLKENNKDILISTNNNNCTIHLKLNVNELPKTNISDIVIFNLPLSFEQNSIPNNNDNYKMNSLNLGNKRQLHNNDISLDKSNIKNINDFIQQLILKIEQLTEENKDIKNRINILERNNNYLIKIIKEKRIKVLEEYLLNNKNNPNYNDNILNKNIFISQKDHFNLNDSFDLEKSPNYFSTLPFNYQKEKEKNESKIFLDNDKEDEKEENYLYSSKVNDEIFDDIEFFKNNGSKSNLSDKKMYDNKNNGNENESDIGKNIMCIDEQEEEKKDKTKGNIFNKIEDNNNNSKNRSSIKLGVVFPFFPSLGTSSFNLKSKKKLNVNKRKSVEFNYKSFRIDSNLI
jgi:hypothetical protein